MLQPPSRFPPAARHDRPLLVVGSCAASLTDELARSGGATIAFLHDEDALAWLDEETPWGAVLAAPPNAALAAELFERGVPVLVCGRDDRVGDPARLMRALRALEA